MAWLQLNFQGDYVKKMDSLIRKFWWNPNKSGNQLYTPVAWSDLCKPLSARGLWFRSFERFNEAMLAKLAWWVLSNRDSFCVTVLRAKYQVRNNWLQARLARSASFSWKGIEGARSLLSHGACKLIGSGEDILVWEDPWIPDSPSFRSSPRVPTETQQCITVAQLMVQDKSAWDESILQSLFDDSTIAAIQNIPRWSKDQNDKWSWLFSTNGTLIIKSAYKVATKEENYAHSNTILGNIWKSSIHDHLKMLL